MNPNALAPPDRRPLPSHPAVLQGRGLCGGLRPRDRPLSGMVAGAGARADGPERHRGQRSRRWRSRACSSAIRRPRPRSRAAATTTPPSSTRAGRGASAASAPSRWARCDDAVSEIEHCLDRLKLQGVCLFASYGDNFLGDPSIRSGAGGARRARCRGVHPSGAASIEPQPRAAVAGLHDGIPVRHHARGGQPRVRRRYRTLSAHPLRAAACRRRRCPISPGGCRCRR